MNENDLKHSVAIQDDDMLYSHSDLGSQADSSNNTINVLGLSKHDFHLIRYSRLLFLGAMAAAAVGLAFVVFFTLQNDEQYDFETQFDTYAADLIEGANNKVENVVQIMDGVQALATNFIELEQEFNNGSYPPAFLTIPHLDQHFDTARNASSALLLAYVPTVAPDELDLWATYSGASQGWIADYSGEDAVTDPILPNIWDFPFDGQNPEDACDGGQSRRQLRMLQSQNTLADGREPISPEEGPFAPVWTFTPAPLVSDTIFINHDLFGKAEFEQAVQSLDITRRGMFIHVCDLANWFGTSDSGEAESTLAYPVFADYSNDAAIVGHLIEIIPWYVFFQDLLPEGTPPVNAVLESSCGDVISFEVNGRIATVTAVDSDVHQSDYNKMKVSEPFAEFTNPPNVEDLDDICVYTVSVYPTETFDDEYTSMQPILFSLLVVAVFIFTSGLFLLFDWLARRQQSRVMDTAKRQNAIVSSLFPKSIQAQILDQVDSDSNKLSKIGKAGLRNYLFQGEDPVAVPDGITPGGSVGGIGINGLDKSKPIADLFPDTTIMFADISGFTAWSSAREPSQVFTLLETIYHEFDQVAKRRRVFKVEVVGDCYVAVCGLPDPREDHAVVMAKFSTECVREMNRLTTALEIELGPDTAELSLRVGLHSGPVVAGVLRGEKSRFQLFGDTMNTASRMESTGVPNKIQISQETADLLMAAKKEHWLEERDTMVEAKGKGKLVTYFLVLDGVKGAKRRGSGSGASISDHSTHSAASSLNSGNFLDANDLVGKRNRIADWTVEVLCVLLKEIEVRRRASDAKKDPSNKLVRAEQTATFTGEGTVIDEVREIIELPEFDHRVAQKESKMDSEDIMLSTRVVEELQHFVRTIASMYHENPFHNFPHANHVTMSVVKLLSRINAPDASEVKTTLHDHTYGITSDPLTRFAVVFAALIHDVDHMGVSNMQLAKEKDPLSQLYKDKSVAEQNSIDIAWDLLMESKYDNLRGQIYATEAEFIRFRQLVINTVLATDIMDKDLKDLRNKRWADAFAVDSEQQSCRANNRKATIVIEHLIQASDVAHTMQHWHIYRKWNERLFQELYKAWEEGRLENDPSTNWYKGEMGFFDFYIIPLAKKLKDCGVFGVSSDEYLSYAVQNRKEWEGRGEALVEDMLKAVRRKKVAKSMFVMNQEQQDREGRDAVAKMSEDIQFRSSKEDLAIAVGNLDDSSTDTNSAAEFDIEDEMILSLKS